MSVYGDWCPYCGEELEPEDLFEVCDCSGNETDELFQCPNCHKVFRASLESVLSLSIQGEEDYLQYLKYREKQLIDRIKHSGDKEYMSFYKEELATIQKEIEKSRKYVEKNERDEWEEDEI